MRNVDRYHVPSSSLEADAKGRLGRQTREKKSPEQKKDDQAA